MNIAVPANVIDRAHEKALEYLLKIQENSLFNPETTIDRITGKGANVNNASKENIKPEILKLFSEKPELANQVYEVLGFSSSNINNIVIQTSIPQNLVSGIESFGTNQEANTKAKELLGSNPHSIDMIEAGIRTRTTRSVGEMKNYNIKVGDIVKQFGKSSNGSTKTILTKITAIYPKGTPEFISTWYKEGWTQEGVEAIKRYKDGAAAIEFEVISDQQISPQQKQEAQQLYSQYLSNFVNTNFDGIIADLQAKNLLEKKCS